MRKKGKNRILVKIILAAIMVIELAGCSDITSLLEQSINLEGKWYNGSTKLVFDTSENSMQTSIASYVDGELAIIDIIFYTDTDFSFVNNYDKIQFYSENFDSCIMEIGDISFRAVELSFKFDDEVFLADDYESGPYKKIR